MRFALRNADGTLREHRYFDQKPPDPVGKGWYWEEDPDPPPQPLVPRSLNNHQLRAALMQSGRYAAAKIYIGGLSEAEQVEWQFSQVIDRDGSLILAAQAALGLSDAQVDALFILGGTLRK